MAATYVWAWFETLRYMVMSGDDERGQNGLEYALVAGVVVVAIIGAFNAFPIGSIVTTGLNKVKNLMS